MKEISVIEMDDVSGAYSWNFADPLSFVGSLVSNAGELVAATAVGLTIGAAAGGYIGGRHGGDGGGVLGFGLIGEGIGLIAGAVLGGASGGLYGAVTGMDSTLSLFDHIADGFLDGTMA